jgi:hypothetical protein
VGGFVTPFPPQSNNFGIDAEANFAWDRSPDAHNGRVYLVYTDRPSINSFATQNVVRFSDDNGATWSDPVQVSDDSSTGLSKMLPAIAVDQTTGNLVVGYYDSRNDPGSGPGDTDGKPDTDAEYFVSLSTDGGLTFQKAVQVAAGPSNSADSEPLNNSSSRPLGYGDYQYMDFNAGVIWPVWADNSNSTGNNPDGALSGLDIYTSEVDVSGTGGGGGGGPPPALTFTGPHGNDLFEAGANGVTSPNGNDTSDSPTPFFIQRGTGGSLSGLPASIPPGSTQTFNLAFSIWNHGDNVDPNLPQSPANLAGLPDYDWFEFFPDSAGRFIATISYQPRTTGDLYMNLYTEADDGSLTLLNQSTNTAFPDPRYPGLFFQGVSTTQVQANKPLLVEVYGFNGAQGIYDMQVSLN